MKKFYSLLILLIYFSNVYSQSREVSVSYSSYKISGNYFFMPDIFIYEEINYVSYNELFNINYGYYFPLIRPTKNMSFGINATGQCGILFHAYGESSDKVRFDFGLPVTANYKVGAGSNKFATLPVGLGLGLGFRPNLLLADENIFKTDKKSLFHSFFRPYFTFEIAFDFQKGNHGLFDNLKIQFAFQPVLKQSYHEYKIDATYGNSVEYFSVSLIKFGSFK